MIYLFEQFDTMIKRIKIIPYDWLVASKNLVNLKPPYEVWRAIQNLVIGLDIIDVYICFDIVYSFAGGSCCFGLQNW